MMIWRRFWCREGCLSTEGSEGLRGVCGVVSVFLLFGFYWNIYN